MNYSIIRIITRTIPLPGRIIRKYINKYDEIINYPSSPQIVSTKYSNIKFEIRNYREYIQQNISLLGYYELRETILMKRILKTGDIFVDVGANIGWFTVLAASKVGPKGKVYAFEPSSKIYDHLLVNININNIKNVIPEKIALTNNNDRVVLKIRKGLNEGLGTIIEQDYNTSDYYYEEACTDKLDDYYKKKINEKIKLIKIDVEGAEYLVLDGMKELLEQKKCENIIVELEENRLRSCGLNIDKICEMLKQYGYSIYEINMFSVSKIKKTKKTFINVFAKIN